MDSIKFAISFVVFGYFIFSTSYLISLAVPVQRRYLSYLVMTVIGGAMAFTLGGPECASGALCGALGPLMFLAGVRQKLRVGRNANRGSERAERGVK